MTPQALDRIRTLLGNIKEHLIEISTIHGGVVSDAKIRAARNVEQTWVRASESLADLDETLECLSVRVAGIEPYQPAASPIVISAADLIDKAKVGCEHGVVRCWMSAEGPPSDAEPVCDCQCSECALARQTPREQDPDDDYGPLHHVYSSKFCRGGRNDTAKWSRVTCESCLKSRPTPSPSPPTEETKMEQRHHDGHGLNDRLTITCDKRDPNAGGASHMYAATMIGVCGNVLDLTFQHGQLDAPGSTLGITDAALLAVMLDRYEGFQAGPYACRENALVITKLEEALHWMNHRANERPVGACSAKTRPRHE